MRRHATMPPQKRYCDPIRYGARPLGRRQPRHQNANPLREGHQRAYHQNAVHQYAVHQRDHPSGRRRRAEKCCPHPW